MPAAENVGNGLFEPNMVIIVTFDNRRYKYIIITSSHNLKFVYFLVVNNNKYLPHVVDNIIFGINVPDYPSRTVESKSLLSFWNFKII